MERSNYDSIDCGNDSSNSHGQVGSARTRDESESEPALERPQKKIKIDHDQTEATSSSTVALTTSSSALDSSVDQQCICGSGPFLYDLCLSCANQEEVRQPVESPTCQVCLPDPPHSDEVPDPPIFQSRFLLPPSNPQMRSMLGVVLQDLDRLLYKIPFIPTPLVDLIAEYASISTTHDSISPLQAVVFDCPDVYSRYDGQWRAEYHSAQQLRAAFIRGEGSLRLPLAHTYLNLHGDEMQQFREKYSIPRPPETLDPFRIALSVVGSQAIPLKVQRMAANKMQQLLFSIDNTVDEERTPFQQDIWLQCEKWRDRLLKRMHERTMQLTAPMDRAFIRWLEGSRIPFNLTEFMPQSGELVTTTRVATDFQDISEPPNERWKPKCSERFWNQYAPRQCHDHHSSSIVSSLTDSDVLKCRNVQPPPF